MQRFRRVNAMMENGRNRLSGESSAYLLAHADNPVNWYPWGDEAFDLARAEDKPVFLSIGYSSCHWCHVMEEESFQDAEVAALMNDAFICIKVDREERPDIDNLYMRFTVAMTGSGGWPMTVILTPDGDPFFAATYLPRTTSFGRTGMIQLLPVIAQQWSSNRDEIVAHSLEVRNTVLQGSRLPSSSDESADGAPDSAFSSLSNSFDPEFGGFGSSPKFPSPHNLLFLLRYWKTTGEQAALDMVCRTLRAIRAGGIFDQIGYGIHRYSTDREWLVPHFEKMLYDQAMLSMAFLEAYQATADEYFATAASEIFQYVKRDMTSSSGAFYSSEDADSFGGEGAFYTWTLEEMSGVLSGEELDLAVDCWNVSGSGNFSEAATLAGNRNILHMSPDDENHLPYLSEDIRSILENARQKLFTARENRPEPFRDEKILADWNGLMIASLARASIVLDDPAYLEAATGAFEFIRDSMMTDHMMLYHSFGSRRRGSEGFLDDYSFLIWGCLELYRASMQQEYLSAAIELQGFLDAHFRDDSGGGYYFTSDSAGPQIPRLKESYDGAVPSGNSIELLNLITLWKLTGRQSYLESASGIEAAFASNISSSPSAFSMMTAGVMYGQTGGTEVILVGSPNDPIIIEMMEVLRYGYRPWTTVSLIDPDCTSSFPAWVPDSSLTGEEASAYVCRGGTCSLPVSSSTGLRELIGP
jgi:uncharacterized protein